MKKTFLKPLALVALLLCGLTASVAAYADGAEQYQWCHATNSDLQKDYGTAYLTWATAANGDVVITIDGATFRNGGFENKDGSWAASWNVLSGTDLSTTESASLYFDGGTLSDDLTTYTIAKKTDAILPDGAVLQFAGWAFSWKIDTHEPYFMNPDLRYTYGVNCVFLDAPTNVAVTDAGVITFTEVNGASKYIANIYSGSTLVDSEEVTNGATLSFQSYVAAAYTVKVVAQGVGMSDSPESDGATWNVSASPLPASKFCSTPADAVLVANEGPCNPLFTIQTQANGDVTIVLSAGEGNEGETMFREKGMGGVFTLNGSEAEFTTYFDRALTDNYTYTLSLKAADNKPALGSVIGFSGQIEAKSSIHNNDWSQYRLDGYLYGTTCPTDVAVTGVTLDNTEATLPLNKTLTLHATVAPANAADKTITWTSSNEDAATVAAGVVTPVAEGTTTITVTTTDGGFTATCVVTVVAAVATEPAAAPAAPTYSAAQVKAIYSETYDADCEFGDWDGGSVYTQDTYGKKFVNGGLGYFGLQGFALNCAAMEHFHADVWVEDNCSMRFVPITGQAEQGVTKDLVGGQWNSIEIALNEGAWANTTDWTNVTQFKIDNAPNITLWLNNVYFYTTTDADTENPVMGTATLVEGSASYTSVVLNVEATDNRGVSQYLVKNGETEIGKFVPVDGKITVTGLSEGTTLTLSVFALDAAENVSENSAEVVVTTLAFPAPASAPNVTGKDFLAIYADGIELAVAHDFTLNTWGGAAYNLVSKDNQNYILYDATTVNWTAWGVNNDGNEAIIGKDDCKGTKGGVNASAMEYLHVDIWTDADCPSFELFVNDTKLGGQALTGEGWHSIDFKLSDYPANPINDWGLDNVNWLKFVGWNGVKYVGLDNVYFWKAQGPATSFDAVETSSAAKKIIENGQLVIIRDGVRYNVMGNVIR